MCWEANCLGLINYFANIYANYIYFVCKITSKKQAIIFSGFALSYSLFTQNAIIEKGTLNKKKTTDGQGCIEVKNLSKVVR